MTKSGLGLEMKKKGKNIHTWSEFQDCIHLYGWHIAWYCCFIQSAPRLAQMGYLKLEVLLFDKKLLNLRHPPFGTLTPRYNYYLHQALSHHRIRDVMPMIETFISETSRHRNLTAFFAARSENGGGINSGGRRH